MLAGKAFHHVVSEARIAQIMEQELLVGLHDGLNIGALMVDVAHAGPSAAVVIVASETHIVLGCLRSRYPFGGRSAIAVLGVPVVIGHDVGGMELVSYVFIRFLGEVPPARSLMMVDNHVGNGEQSLILESLDHALQLVGGAKTTVLIEVIIRVIARSEERRVGKECRSRWS